MTGFTIEIARTAFRVGCQFGSTPEYCRRYLTDSPPAYRIAITPEDRQQEQQLLDEEADREGLRRRVFTDPFLERTVIQRKIAELLLQQDILLLHGSTVAMDGRAYLFTAKCGVGKSTHTRLWREVYGEQVTTVNDDRAFLALAEDGVLAFGSPWSGKHGLDSNLCVPLAGICILERGREDCITPLAAEAALPLLLEQAYLPREEQQSCLEALTKKLTDTVPLWRMACTKERSAAELSYRTMSGSAG